MMIKTLFKPKPRLSPDATIEEVNRYYSDTGDRLDTYFIAFLIFLAGSWLAILVLRWIFTPCTS